MGNTGSLLSPKGNKKILFDIQKLSTALFSSPFYSPLPNNRVQPFAFFSHTSVNYMGLLTTKKNKIWIILFTSLSTRAIHLEIVTNLSTESFILFFHRFVSRCSKPLTLISDNDKSFV